VLADGKAHAAAEILVDETLGAIDPTIFVTSTTIEAAIADLEASGAVKTLGGVPEVRIVVRMPRSTGQR